MNRVEVKEFVTTHEASRLLFVTPTTIIQWVKDGKLKTIKTPGGHRRIARADVNALLETMIEAGRNDVRKKI